MIVDDIEFVRKKRKKVQEKYIGKKEEVCVCTN